MTSNAGIVGCIDVGHAPEVGCLIDMTEPGCNAPTFDAAVIDAGTSDRTDAGSDDGLGIADGGAPDGVPNGEGGGAIGEAPAK